MPQELLENKDLLDIFTPLWFADLRYVTGNRGHPDDWQHIDLLEVGVFSWHGNARVSRPCDFLNCLTNCQYLQALFLTPRHVFNWVYPQRPGHV